jgi:hypothetical protein
MARAAAACCSATVLLLAVAIFTSNASAEPLSGVQTIDRVGDGEKSDLLLSVNQDTGKDQEKTKAGKHREDDAGEVASSTSTEEEGKAGSDWAKAKKVDDDEKGDSDSDSDSASSSDSDSSGSDSDSNSDDDEHSDGDDSSHGKKEAPRGKHGDLLMKQ